ncbi:iron complex transport system permease protein [Treponema bryantii]|uniref:Iron complex transport system permease protein n=1 Tax=Treponema bryantii TaxID=163 RepID=A0A1H9GUE4_9SPIR|nr:iron ABC transporter permease [Treponema bryantii]SEQ53694.1 iron complex transport system permease protein [Treponema bryantii]
MKRKSLCWKILSSVLLIISVILALMLGAEKVSLAAVFGQGDKFENIILWQLRLPRVLLVFLTGLLLGGSGAVFQLFFRNPLAEPGIMGISSGATLGAVIASIVPGIMALTGKGGVGAYISPVNLCAFAGALVAGLFVTSLAFSRGGRSSSVMLLLCGTALGTLYSSLSSMLLLTCNKELHSIYTWILGSFNGRGWNELLFILLPSVVSIILMFVVSRPLDLLTGGEKSAAALGVEVDRLRVLVLLCGALAVSAAVCAGGTIGFVGLIAPHIVRKFLGPKARTLVPFSMIFGAALLLLSDTLARVIIAPGELPAGIITSILGVPFFLALCLGGRK